MDVSIITAVLNGEKYLREAIESFLSQDFKGESELVLVVEPSSDRTEEIADSFTDPRIRVIKNPKRMGMQSKLIGARAAKGKYIGFLDADDVMEPNLISTAYERIEKGFDCVDFGHFEFKGKKKPNAIGHPERKRLKSEKCLKDMFMDLSVRPFLWSKLYRRDLFDEAVRFDLPLDTLFDDSIINVAFMLKAKEVSYLKKPLYRYRLNVKSSATGRPNKGRLFAHLKTMVAIRVLLERDGRKAVLSAWNNRYIRTWISLKYDEALSSKSGLSKEELKSLRKTYSSLRSRKPFPLKGSPYEEFVSKIVG